MRWNEFDSIEWSKGNKILLHNGNVAIVNKRGHGAYGDLLDVLTDGKRVSVSYRDIKEILYSVGDERPAPSWYQRFDE